MAATIIDGRKIASAIQSEVRKQVSVLKTKNIIPKLCVILAGEDPASVLYAKAKKRACSKSGISYELFTYSEDAKDIEIIEKLEELSSDPTCHGIMVELPLPEHMNKAKVVRAVDPLKDVDGINPVNKGLMFTQKTGLFPVTPQSCMEIFKRSGILLEGKDVCLIGCGDTVGKPLILMLLNENATLTVCHIFTRDLAYHTKNAEIIISAAGKAGLVTKDMVRPGAIVIDAGINQVNGKTVGDVAFEEVSEVAAAITPVPGGVGSLTTALIQRNLLKALELQYQSRH